VKLSDKSLSFGLRLKEAFNGAQNKEIAHKLGVSNSAITTYMNGRIPPPITLVEISRLTSCSIHWLIMGDGSKWVSNPGRFEASSTHTIVLANQKGGEAKSTSATVLAGEFAKRGYRTLLIDTPKGDCTSLLFSSILNSDNPETVSFSNMMFRLEMKGRGFFRTTFKGLDLCTSNERLQASLIAGKVKRFTPNLSLIHKEYSFVILDTDSSVHPFNNTELFMASMRTPTSVLIPTCGDFLSLAAVRKTLGQLDNTQKFASNLNVLGTFLTRHRYKKIELANTINKLNRILPGQVLKTVVREDSSLLELGEDRKYQLSWSASHGFVAYSKLAEEILTLLGK
jgi:chromosome partitioning protein